ncbi:MAG TPA: hypothetical protein VN620_16340, partial [Candidatus Methylomirabilis sp.]|nr:hypothetical protein [Candidatus Methylomirabilis sp.]
DDNELAGTLFPGDPRRLDFEKFNASRDLARCDDGEHAKSSNFDSAEERPDSLWHASQPPVHTSHPAAPL